MIRLVIKSGTNKFFLTETDSFDRINKISYMAMKRSSKY
jgi:hypothetical protein